MSSIKVRRWRRERHVNNVGSDCFQRRLQLMSKVLGTDAAQQQDALEILLECLLTSPEELRRKPGPVSHSRSDVVFISSVSEGTDRRLVDLLIVRYINNPSSNNSPSRASANIEDSSYCSRPAASRREDFIKPAAYTATPRRSRNSQQCLHLIAPA